MLKDVTGQRLKHGHSPVLHKSSKSAAKALHALRAHSAAGLSSAADQNLRYNMVAMFGQKGDGPVPPTV